MRAYEHGQAVDTVFGAGVFLGYQDEEVGGMMELDGIDDDDEDDDEEKPRCSAVWIPALDATAYLQPEATSRPEPEPEAEARDNAIAQQEGECGVVAAAAA